MASGKDSQRVNPSYGDDESTGLGARSLLPPSSVLGATRVSKRTGSASKKWGDAARGAEKGDRANREVRFTSSTYRRNPQPEARSAEAPIAETGLGRSDEADVLPDGSEAADPAAEPAEPEGSDNGDIGDEPAPAAATGVPATGVPAATARATTTARPPAGRAPTTVGPSFPPMGPPYPDEPGSATFEFLSLGRGRSSEAIARWVTMVQGEWANAPCTKTILESHLAIKPTETFLTMLQNDPGVKVVHGMRRCSVLGSRVRGRIMAFIGEGLRGRPPTILMKTGATPEKLFNEEEHEKSPDTVFREFFTDNPEEVFRGVSPPVTQGNEMAVREMVILPVEWAPYFLDDPIPITAYLRMKTLIAEMPVAAQGSFQYLLDWCMAAATLNNVNEE